MTIGRPIRSELEVKINMGTVSQNKLLNASDVKSDRSILAVRNGNRRYKSRVFSVRRLCAERLSESFLARVLIGRQIGGLSQRWTGRVPFQKIKFYHF